MEVLQEYWILLDNTDILAVFSTLQECLLWKPPGEILNPNILRVKQMVDGTFRKQAISVNPDIYAWKI